MSRQLKPDPNRARYLEIVRRMTPEQRMHRAVELTEMTGSAFKAGLRSRYPELSDAELQKRYIEQLSKWHNLTY